jgi:hypothetical protein
MEDKKESKTYSFKDEGEKLKESFDDSQDEKQETADKEKALKEKDKSKKQILLRLSPSLWNELASWAEDDFRSINGQIEYLLSESIRKRKGK